MKDSFGLTSNAIEKIESVLKKYAGIEKAVIYGSRAKGNYKLASDIDLTLFGLELTVKDLLKIENELDDLMLPFKFDISLFHQIKSKDLIDHIGRIGRVFYSRSP